MDGKGGGREKGRRRKGDGTGKGKGGGKGNGEGAGTGKGKAQERDGKGKGDIWCGHRGSPEDKIQCKIIIFKSTHLSMHNDTFWYIFIFGRYSPGEPTCQL